MKNRIEENKPCLKRTTIWCVFAFLSDGTRTTKQKKRTFSIKNRIRMKPANQKAQTGSGKFQSVGLENGASFWTHE
jgi:hypothetical protein